MLKHCETLRTFDEPLAKIDELCEFGEVQKNVDFIDLEKYWKMSLLLYLRRRYSRERAEKMYDVTPLHLHAIQSPEYRSKTSANDNETLLY